MYVWFFCFFFSGGGWLREIILTLLISMLNLLKTKQKSNKNRRFHLGKFLRVQRGESNKVRLAGTT